MQARWQLSARSAKAPAQNGFSASSTFFFKSNKAIWFPPTPSLCAPALFPSPSLALGLFIQNVETICRKANNVSWSEGRETSLLCILTVPEVKHCFFLQGEEGVDCFPFFLLLSFNISLNRFPSCQSWVQTRATRSDCVFWRKFRLDPSLHHSLMRQYLCT